MINDFLSRQPNHISIEGMSFDDWLQRRREGIGGSDAGAIMGLSNFGSRLTVYLQKKGLVESKGNAATRRGNLLEPVIRQIAQEDFPALQIEKIPYMFFSKKHPFMLANIDSIIWAENEMEINGKTVEGWGGHECKSSKSGYGYGADEVPDDHYAQVSHYMEVLDLQWFLLSVYILETEEVRHYVILRNQEFIDELILKEADFWENYYLKDNMPPAVGIDSEDEMITSIFDGSDSTLNLTDEEVELCRLISYLKEQIKPLEKQEEAAKTDLKAKLIARAMPNETKKSLSAIGGPFSVSWTTFETKRVDSEKMKRDNIYEMYTKRSESSRLTVSLRKGD